MPQFEPSTFSPQLFWLVVTFAVLFFAMWRHALPRISGILEARQQRIGSDLEKAAAFKAETEQVAAEYEKALAQARDEAAAALKQAGAEMAAEAAKRHESFGKELTARTGEAERRIAAARDEALGNIKSVAEETAGAAAAKLIGVELSPGQLRDAVEDALRRRE
ncbi:MAG: F0F1 ATP synthase subunit B family protein [Alphaproteobacteria bacterium]